MSDFAEANRRAWNEVHRRRHETFGAKVGLRDDVLARLEPLAGARVLHLQCATGETSAQLVARGADLTGVDISDEAVAVATETVPGARFVTADVHALPGDLREFDVVVTEGGVLVWLNDLDAWARGIAGALRDNGRLMLAEEHPVAACIDGDRWVEPRSRARVCGSTSSTSNPRRPMTGEEPTRAFPAESFWSLRSAERLRFPTAGIRRPWDSPLASSSPQSG